MNLADKKTRIAFVYFDAGGGHRASMEALSEVIRSQRPGWEVAPVDLQAVLREHDFLERFWGVNFAEAYTRWLSTGWTVGATQGVKLLHGIIRGYEPKLLQTLSEHWRREPAGMVVSVVSHFNRIIARSVRAASPDVPFVTILTDIADFPPHFWIEKESQYIICGSERAEQQANKLGHTDGHVFRTSGMVIHPRFYVPSNIDRAQERERLGLQAELPTALVLFGGSGSSAMMEIAQRLEHSRYPLQVIYICGRNQRLAEALRRRMSRHPFFVEGFTREIPYYMRLSDFFVGKPGPGSISEALACGLPVIVQRNIQTLPQERYNAEWVRTERVGVVVRSFGDINGAVTEILANPVYRENARAMQNRAVFEIPEIFSKILASRTRMPTRAGVDVEPSAAMPTVTA